MQRTSQIYRRFFLLHPRWPIFQGRLRAILLEPGEIVKCPVKKDSLAVRLVYN